MGTEQPQQQHWPPAVAPRPLSLPAAGFNSCERDILQNALPLPSVDL